MNVEHFRVLDVPAGQRAIIAVCNLANGNLRRQTDVTLPSLVRDIGARAVVTVQVINSANRNVSNSFLLRSSPLRKSTASLLGPVVSGNIGHGVSLSVFVSNSANAYLNRGAALYMRDSALVSSLVSPTKCVKHACIDVELSMAGNVIGGREVLVSRAALLKGAFDASCVERTNVFADVRNAGTVRDTERLVLGLQAALSRQLVDIVEAKNSIISVGVADAASATVRNRLSVSASYLIDAVIRVGEGLDVRSIVRMDNVANAVSKNRVDGGGALLAKVVKFHMMNNSTTIAYVRRSAGSMAKSVTGLQTVLTTVAVNADTRNSVVNASLIECGTVIANSLIVPAKMALFGRIADFKRASRTKVNVALFDTGNTRTVHSKIEGSLLRGLVRVRGAEDHVELDVKGIRSANMNCYRGSGEGEITGTLVGREVVVEGKNVRVKLDLDRFANMFLDVENEVTHDHKFVGTESAIDWLRLREAYVGLQLQCNSKVPS